MVPVRNRSSGRTLTLTTLLVGTSIENLQKIFGKFLQNEPRKAGIPELWDGKASERIIDILLTK